MTLERCNFHWTYRGKNKINMVFRRSKRKHIATSHINCHKQKKIYIFIFKKTNEFRHIKRNKLVGPTMLWPSSNINWIESLYNIPFYMDTMSHVDNVSKEKKKRRNACKQTVERTIWKRIKSAPAELKPILFDRSGEIFLTFFRHKLHLNNRFCEHSNRFTYMLGDQTFY